MTGIDSTETPQQIACANCGEPTIAKKRILADHKIYCTKLCAGLGLIQTAYDEDGIDPDMAIDTLSTLVQRSLSEDPVPIPTRVRDCDSEAALELLNAGPIGDRLFMVVISDAGTPDWVPAGKKAKIPAAKVLRFTPTGKSVPVPAQEIADDQLLKAEFPDISMDPCLREYFLAQIKGGDEGRGKYLRDQFPENHPPPAS